MRQSVSLLLTSIAYTAPALVIFFGRVSHLRPVFIDDAYIFYRYATNWAAGYGLVYNIGEHVEGFSSLLWTTMLAVGAALSVRPETLAPILGITSAGVCLLLLERLSSLMFSQSRLLRVVTPLACSLSTGFASYAISGMDTVIFATVLVGAILAAYHFTQGRIIGLSVALVLLVLVRAEGFLYGIVLLVTLAGLSWTGQIAVDRAGYWRVAAVALATMVVQFIGRFIVYGEWVPATVSAKGFFTDALIQLATLQSTDTGLVVLAIRKGLIYNSLLIAAGTIPLAILAVQTVRRTRTHSLAWLLAGPIALNVIITIAAGGDWMPFHRHSVAVWPLLLLLTGWGAVQILRGYRPTVARRALHAGAAAVVIVVGLCAAEEIPRAEHGSVNRVSAAECRSVYKQQVGALLNRVDGPIVLVTNVAGKIPYLAGPHLYSLDLLGLTDRHNSKLGNVWNPRFGRTDYDYSFGRSFDLLVTNNYWDLRQFVAFQERNPRTEGYALYARDAWLASSFFVVADPTSRVGVELARLCKCRLVKLDRRATRYLLRLEGVSREWADCGTGSDFGSMVSDEHNAATAPQNAR